MKSSNTKKDKKKVNKFFLKEDLKPLTKEQLKKMRLNAYKYFN